MNTLIEILAFGFMVVAVTLFFIGITKDAKKSLRDLHEKISKKETKKSLH